MRDFRNEWVWRVCNFLLGKVATPEYGRYLQLMISYGMLRHAEDEGDRIRFFNYWTPDHDKKNSMLAGFLTDDESMVYYSGNRVSYITKNEVKTTIMGGEDNEHS